MSERLKLPNRRPATTIVVTHAGQDYWVTVGQADFDAPPAEVFIQSKITSSTLEAVARDAAILVSFALQFGVCPELMRAAVTREENGSPASVIGAALDAMLAQFPPKDVDPEAPVPSSPSSSPGGAPSFAEATP